MTSVIRGDDDFDSDLLFGREQSWQNMLSPSVLRAFSTNYTNNTGKTIVLHVVALGVGSGGFLTLTVGSIAIESVQAYTANARVTLTVPIPPGVTYSVAPSSVTLASWMELR